MGKRNIEVGRKKLMMKIPAIRSQLQDASGETIEERFTAYQLAVSTRDRIGAQNGVPLEWHSDYDKLFEEIGADVVRHFAGTGRGMIGGGGADLD